MPSTRDTILDAFVTLLQTIKKGDGYNYTVRKVVRKSLFWDEEHGFPVLMVLGGGEEFEDDIGDTTLSRMTVLIRGYTKDKDDPDEALCKLIEDVLICLESSSNTYKDKMQILNLDTDEGWLHDQAEGMGFFIIALRIWYKFTRGAP